MDIFIIMNLIAGLSLFLYGMNLMSDCTQKIASSRLNSILCSLTKTKFSGLILGVFFTSIVQSASATIVMAMSLINAKILSLVNAAGIIMGANIGTAITSQLISFKLNSVAPIFIFIGIILVIFVRDIKIKLFGNIIFGFGILFMGITLMNQSMTKLNQYEQFKNALSTLKNPIFAFLIGLIVTAILQSSSASIGVIQVSCFNHIIKLSTSLFMMLGCNIGATTCALINSINMRKKKAKRAALFHLLINVVGSLILFIVFILLDKSLSKFIISFSGNNGLHQVANANVLIKIIEIILVFPISNLLIKLTEKIIPGDDEFDGDKYKLEYIGTIKNMPIQTMVPHIILEIKRMGIIAINNLKNSFSALFELDDNKIKNIYEKEVYINYLNKKINEAIKISNNKDLPLQHKNLIGALCHVVCDVERIGDHAENVADIAVKCTQNNIFFSKDAKKELDLMLEATCKCFNFALDTFTNNTKKHIEDINMLETLVDSMEIKYSDNCIQRLISNSCSTEAGIIFNDLLTNLERSADHSTNIAFAIHTPTKEKYLLKKQIDSKISKIKKDADFENKILKMKTL